MVLSWVGEFGERENIRSLKYSIRRGDVMVLGSIIATETSWPILRRYLVRYLYTYLVCTFMKCSFRFVVYTYSKFEAFRKVVVHNMSNIQTRTTSIRTNCKFNQKLLWPMCDKINDVLFSIWLTSLRLPFSL